MRNRIGRLLTISHLLFSFSVAFKPYSLNHQTIFNNVEHEPSFSPVSLPVENATRSFWLQDNPLAEEGSKGELSKSAEVCIIGSGITGTSTAWHLSQMMKEYESETRIVVLEAREFCSGATGRNGGHLTPNAFSSFVDRQLKYNTSEAIKSYMIERYTTDALVKFFKDRELESQVDLVEGGRINLLTTEDERRAVRADFEAASAAGLDLSAVQWISDQQLHAEYGLHPSLNYSGVWIPGYNLWPCKLVTELFKDAQAAGGNVSVALHTKTPVTSINRQHNTIDSTLQWDLRTPRGRIKCHYVVHATNGYAGHLLPFFAKGSTESSAQFGVDGTSLRRDFSIIPTRGQVAAVRASINSSRFPWHNAWSDGATYWFPRYQRHDTKVDVNPLIILGGGRAVSGGHLESGETDDGVLNARITKFLKAFLSQKFPLLFHEIDERNWESEWTGIMGFTKLYDPFVGPVSRSLEYDGQYIAAGYSGHGMVRAYACAEAVAGMIRSRIVGENWFLPEWLPERYLTWMMR